MRKIFFAFAFLCFTFGSAYADQAAYCAALARDFADAQGLADKTMWQHKYDISLKACMGKGKPDQVVAKPVVAAPTAKPVVVAPAAKPIVAAVQKPKIVIPPKATVVPDVPKPVDTKSAKLVPGSPEWNGYCTKKYSSFDPTTGNYKSFTGVERKCLYTG